MNTKQTFAASLLCLLFAALSTTGHTQSATPAAYHQKDYIADNPTADRDLQTVSDYLNALVAGDLEKARGLLADTFRGIGPGEKDSSDAEKALNGWREGYKTQSDRKINFVMQTFRALMGDLQGNWVSVWGTYECTFDGKRISVPSHSVFHLRDDGKIDRAGTYYDRLAIMETLGYTLTPPAAAKSKQKK